MAFAERCPNRRFLIPLRVIPVYAGYCLSLIHIWIADELLDCECPGLYNQAIMDFGALQCTPVAPDCLFCPLNGSCVARLKGIAGSLPVKQHKKKVTNRYFNYIYVRMGAYTFIHKRSGKCLLYTSRCV